MLKKPVVALIAFALIGLPACGKSDASSRALALVPKTAKQYAQLSNPNDWSASKQQDFKTLLNTSGEQNKSLDDIFNSEDGNDADLDFSKVVKPWLGDFMAEFQPVLTEDVDDPSVSLFDVGDDDKAKASIAELTTNRPAAAEIVDDVMVYANGKDLCDSCSDTAAKALAIAQVTRVKNLKEDDSLKNDDTFKGLSNKVGSGDLIVYSANSITDEVKNKLSGNDDQAALAKCLSGATPTILNTKASVFAAFSLASSKATFNVAIKNAQKATVSSGSISLMNGLPNTTTIALSTHELGASIGKALKCYGSNTSSQSLDLKDLGTAAGIDVLTAFDFLKGESVIAAGNYQAGEVGLVSDISNTNDGAKAVKGIAGILKAMEIPVTEAGTNKYTVNTGSADAALTFGISGSRFVLAMSSKYFDALAKEASDPLSDLAAYKAVIKSSSKNAAAFFMQPEKLSSALDNTEAKGASALTAIGVQANASDGYTTASGAVTFKASSTTTTTK